MSTKIDVIELMRIRNIAGSFRYKNWAMVVKNKGDHALLQIEYPTSPGAFTMGKKKSGLAYSKKYYVQAQATEAEIMYIVIHAIEETEKLLMMQELVYKGKNLSEHFITAQSLNKYLEHDDVPERK